MKRLPLLLVLVLLLAGVWAGTVKLSYFEVAREGNNFLITWKAETEQEVRSYELFRKTSYAADFASVQVLNAHGIGKEYQFKDDQVYKAASEQVDYRLEAVFTNGVRQNVAERKVNYTPTAIRRTWGSIKAMFQ
jgi:redox-regulated HSP33 family molecular chaperone